MKNHVQPGETITLPAPYDVTSGGGLLVGAIFGVACADAADGEPLEVTLVGVFDLKKAAPQPWAVGDRIYWDDGAERATTTATANTLIGVAVRDVTGSSGEIIGRVRLNASFS